MSAGSGECGALVAFFAGIGSTIIEAGGGGGVYVYVSRGSFDIGAKSAMSISKTPARAVYIPIDAPPFSFLSRIDTIIFRC